MRPRPSSIQSNGIESSSVPFAETSATTTISVSALLLCATAYYLLLYRAALAPTCCLCPDAQMPICCGPLHLAPSKIQKDDALQPLKSLDGHPRTAIATPHIKPLGPLNPLP